MSLLGFKAQNHPQQTVKPQIDDRATTPEDFARFDARFHFTIDVAAATHNAKCARYYDLAANGLERSWAGERVWCNPPYSSIEPWIVKAWQEWTAPQLIVMLLPANRCEQGWWQRNIEPYRDLRPSRRGQFCVEFLPGRMRFVRAGATEVGPNERPPFGCCLAIWTHTSESAAAARHADENAS